MSRQLPFHLLLQPLVALMVLAVGTMPVAAGSIDDMCLAAFFTSVDRGTIVVGAAVDDSIDDLAMICRHIITELSDVLGAVLCEDLFNRCHCHHPPLPN